MAGFGEHYSTKALINVLIRIGIWSGINLGILFTIRYFDHNFIFSETVITILLIPVGLIECASVIAGCGKFKTIHWKSYLLGLSAILNFLLFLYILNSLYSQAGSLRSY